MEKIRGPNEESDLERMMKQILGRLDLEYEYELPVRSGFILDFAFPEIKMAFEVDGYYHQFTKKKDRFRDYILRRGGWRVYHFTGDEVQALFGGQTSCGLPRPA